MNLWVKLFDFFDLEMTTPTNYGWFHLLWIAIIIAISVLLCSKFKDSDDKIFRKIVLITWIVMVVLEIYKQLIFSLSHNGEVFTWDYQWYAFPFQFCSSPLYGLPFIAFLPSGRVRDAFISFFAYFSLFAGVAVFLYPNDVFISTIGINIQTMVHHGAQIFIGVFLIARNRKSLTHKFFLSGVTVFAAFVIVAMILNVSVHNMLLSAGIDETFNMFYVSPYFDCTLPVLSSIDAILPYPVFACVYVFGFTIVAMIIYFISRGVVRIIEKGAPRVK